VKTQSVTFRFRICLMRTAFICSNKKTQKRNETQKPVKPPKPAGFSFFKTRVFLNPRAALEVVICGLCSDLLGGSKNMPVCQSLCLFVVVSLEYFVFQ